jgi:hypothetical protein
VARVTSEEQQRGWSVARAGMEEASLFPARVPLSLFPLPGRTYPSPPPYSPVARRLYSATGSGQRTRPTMPVSAHASAPLTSPCRGERIRAPRRGREGLRPRGGGDRPATSPWSIDRLIDRSHAAARLRCCSRKTLFFSVGLRRSIHRSYPSAFFFIPVLIQLAAMQPR